jgi:hypothetical protein
MTLASTSRHVDGYRSVECRRQPACQQDADDTPNAMEFSKNGEIAY